MKIAYDAKRFFHNTSGLGNYSRDLVRILSEYYPENEYLLITEKDSTLGKETTQRKMVKTTVAKGFLARQFKFGLIAQKAHSAIYHGLSGELPLCWNSTNIKKVVTIHDLIFLRYPELYSFLDRKVYCLKFKKATEIADIVIAISEQTKADIIDYLHTPEEKIKVIYQGCHPAFKTTINYALEKEVIHKFNLPPQFILSVGTIEERKNLLRVIQALRGTDLPLVAVGRKTKYYRKILEEMAKHQQKVLFLENVNLQELSTIYKLAQIFIYPSLFEGFGIPIIEALYSKTPVITSNTSCLPEAGGPHSIYVNPLSVEDIRDKILWLWNDEAQRKNCVEKGVNFVQKFNDENIATNLIQVYKMLLQ